MNSYTIGVVGGTVVRRTQRLRADFGARPLPCSRVLVAVMAGTPGLVAMSRLGASGAWAGPRWSPRRRQAASRR